MPELAPEAKAREQIDVLLAAAGWTLQDYTRFDASASRTIALREIPVSGGRCDYLLLIGRHPVGVIEAKNSGNDAVDGRGTVRVLREQPARVPAALDRSAALLLRVHGGRNVLP